MNFSNKFKICWWVGILLILSVVGIYRICIAEFNAFDITLIILWFSLVLFPIISEVSFLGFSIKKDIEKATQEIKSSIMEIRNTFQPVVNINNFDKTTPSKDELEKKVKSEIKEESESVDYEKKAFLLEENNESRRIIENEKIRARVDRLLGIEELVNKKLSSEYGDLYKSNTKFKDESLGKFMIVDGLIFNKIDRDKIDKIVEIKFITIKSFAAFYYIAFKFVQKLYKFGLRIPVHFIIISDSMDESVALFLNKQILKVNANRNIIPFFPVSTLSCYNIIGEELTEIKINK